MEQPVRGEKTKENPKTLSVLRVFTVVDEFLALLVWVLV